MGKKKKGTKGKRGKPPGNQKLKPNPDAAPAKEQSAPAPSREDQLLARFKELNPEFPDKPTAKDYFTAIIFAAQKLMDKIVSYELARTSQPSSSSSEGLPFEVAQLESLIFCAQSDKTFHLIKKYQELGEILHQLITKKYIDAQRAQLDTAPDLAFLKQFMTPNGFELLQKSPQGSRAADAASKEKTILNYWPLLPLLGLNLTAFKVATDGIDLQKMMSQTVLVEIKREANLEVFEMISQSPHTDFDTLFTKIEEGPTILEYMIYLTSTFGDKDCRVQNPKKLCAIIDFVIKNISAEAINSCIDGDGVKILAKLIKIHIDTAKQKGKQAAIDLLEKYIMDIADKMIQVADGIVLHLPDEDTLPEEDRGLISQKTRDLVNAINKKKSSNLSEIVRIKGLDPDLTSAEIERKLGEAESAAAQDEPPKVETKKPKSPSIIKKVDPEISAIKIQRAFRNWRQKRQLLASQKTSPNPIESLVKAYQDNSAILETYQEFSSFFQQLQALQQKESNRIKFFQQPAWAVSTGYSAEIFMPLDSYQDQLEEAAAYIKLQEQIALTNRDLYELNQKYFQSVFVAALQCVSVSAAQQIAIADIYRTAIVSNNMPAFEALNKAGLYECTDQHGYSPIYLAAINKRPDLVNHLLQCGAEIDIGVKDEFGRHTGVISQLVRSRDQGESVFTTLMTGGVNPAKLIELANDDDCEPQQIEMINRIAISLGYQEFNISEKIAQCQDEKYKIFSESQLMKLFIQCSELSDHEQMLQIFSDHGIEAQPDGIIDKLLEKGLHKKENHNVERFFTIVRECGFKVAYSFEEQESAAEPNIDVKEGVLEAPGTKFLPQQALRAHLNEPLNQGVTIHR